MTLDARWNYRQCQSHRGLWTWSKIDGCKDQRWFMNLATWKERNPLTEQTLAHLLKENARKQRRPPLPTGLSSPGKCASPEAGTERD